MHRATSAAENGPAPFARLHVATGVRSASDSSLQSLDNACPRERQRSRQTWTAASWAALRSRAPSPASTWAFCVGAALGMMLMSTLILGAALHRDRGAQPSAAAATSLVRGSNVLQAEHAASAAEAMLRAAAALAAGLDRRDTQSNKARENANNLSRADADNRLAGADTPTGDTVDMAVNGGEPGYDEAEDEADDYGTQLSDGAPTPASHNRAAWVALRTAALSASKRASSLAGVNRPSKIAFLFLTRGPLPHARLWERFFQGHDGEFVVHVHASPGFELNESTVASPVFYGRTIASPVVVEWGQMSVVAAERRLFATALLDSDVAQFFVLLSESCVPLRSFSYVKEYLLNNGNKSFLDSFIDVQSRYNPRMAPTIPEAQWRKGTQWAAVTRAHAELFVSDELVFSVMRRHCRTWTDPEGRYGAFCAGDEHYKQVILQILGFEHEIERRPVTFANWFPTTRAHPKLYVVQEVTAELVQDLQVCCMLWAIREDPPLELKRHAQSRTELWRPMEGEHMRCGVTTDAKTCATHCFAPVSAWLCANRACVAGCSCHAHAGCLLGNSRSGQDSGFLKNMPTSWAFDACHNFTRLPGVCIVGMCHGFVAAPRHARFLRCGSVSPKTERSEVAYHHSISGSTHSAPSSALSSCAVAAVTVSGDTFSCCASQTPAASADWLGKGSEANSHGANHQRGCAPGRRERACNAAGRKQARPAPARQQARQRHTNTAARTKNSAALESLMNCSSACCVRRLLAMPLPDMAQKMAVKDVVQGSGSAVLPRISGTATAHASATKPTDKCARHTAAKRCLIAAERW